MEGLRPYIFFIFVLIELCQNKCVFGQSKYNYFGVMGHTQYTQSTMFAQSKTPYYNVWDYNSGLGIYLGMKRGKNVFNFKYSRARLLNSYNIVKYEFILTANDKKNTKNLNSVYWTTNEYQTLFERCYFEKPKYEVFIMGGCVIYNGQLNNSYFPDYSQPPNNSDIVFYNGKKGIITYNIYEQSVREWGFGLLFGTSMKYKWNNSFASALELAWNSGLTPLVSTLVVYDITSPDVQGNAIGDYNSLSSNSGIRLSIGIHYNFSIKK